MCLVSEPFLLASAAACQETEGTTFLELADCQGLHVSKMQAVETHFVCLKVQGKRHFEESSCWFCRVE